MATTPDQLNADALEFLRERHLATLTSVRDDGTAHVVPVAFTWDAPAGLARITTNRASVKARLAVRGSTTVTLCQVDGPRWLTLQGPATVSADPGRVRAAVDRYAERYRVLADNPERVVIEIGVARVLGSARLLGT